MSNKPNADTNVQPSEEEDQAVADNTGKGRKGGNSEDELLAKSGKSGGLTDDVLLAASGRKGGLVEDNAEDKSRGSV